MERSSWSGDDGSGCRKVGIFADATPFIPQSSVEPEFDLESEPELDPDIDKELSQEYQDQFGSAYPQETFQSQHRNRRQVLPMFMNESFYQQLSYKNRLLNMRLDSNDPRFRKDIPITVHRDRFHSLFPLEHTGVASVPSPLFSFMTFVYKATRSKTNAVVALFRMQGCILSDDISNQALEPWKLLCGNPNIVGVQDVFCCKDFKDGGSLCFVYDFYPGAITLYDYFVQGTAHLTQDIIWSIICQVVSALASIHSAGLACQVIEPRKILLPSPSASNRIRINCCGVKDVVTVGIPPSIADLQAKDVQDLAFLIMYLILKRAPVAEDITTTMSFIDVQYSKGLGRALRMMLDDGENGRRPSIFDVSQIIHHRILRELQHSYIESDAYATDLAVEAQNGRLFRLLAKCCFINERPGFLNDSQCTVYAT
uniref:Protein kinase domain-containing protein n=1 Tax=Spongospora subterranea TaxID=70186 RepID=A0A0H5R2M4_9EUKA|eukprot:CRZ02139.1 hypothetical protein [Spongospora subterranea]